MKISIYTLLLSACLASLSWAQTKTDHYVFPEFKQGVVVMKDGTRQSGMINFNGINKNFIINEGGNYTAMTKKDIMALDSVYVDNRTFIYRDNQFYEFLFKSKNAELLVEYESELKSNTENRNAYGSTSQTTSTQVISTVENQGVILNNDLPATYSVETKLLYTLIKNGKTQTFKNMNQLKKLYSSKKKEYNAYRKENDVDFYVPRSIAELVIYLELLD